MPFDITSYLMGEEKGKVEGAGTVIIDGNEYEFTDANNDGHIVITERSDG